MDDKVFLKVTPMKGVMRFDKKGKLSLKFIDPFEILEKVGDMGYRLALSPLLSRVYNIFHVSMLRKYILNLEHVIRYELLYLKDNLTYEETPARILNCKEQVMRKRKTPFVKVIWPNHSIKDAT